MPQQLLARLQVCLAKTQIMEILHQTFLGENMEYDNLNLKDLFCRHTKDFKS